jgi:uncharacterized protein (TIGR00369 family)
MIQGMSKDDQILNSRRNHIIKLASNAPIVRTYGMSLSYDAEGRAVWEMPYNSNFDHAAGGIHGGVFATLLDNAGWFTVAPYFENWISTIEYETRLLEHVEKEDLKAVGEIVKLGKRISFAEMKIWSGSGKLVATGSGSFTTTQVPFLFNP